MANYLGKKRLTLLLYDYLEQSAPEKLSELKRELKDDGEYRKYKILYRKYRNSEWLNTNIYFDGIEYRFEMFACGSKGKSVVIREKKVIADDYDESVTQTYSGVAYYDGNFNLR